VDEDLERRKRIRRTALILVLVALSFYLGFIALSVMRSHA
jgi:hypothetical protein